MPRTTLRTFRIATVIALVGSIAQAQSVSARPPLPCAADTLRHAFDFWVGEWTVTGPDGKQVGTSRVEVVSAGCALLENWHDSRGVEGKSLNTYDPSRRQWRQFWIGPMGGVTDYTRSEWHEGTMAFYTEPSPGPAGAQPLLRLTFTRLAPDRVRQHGEQSTDAGRTWTTQYDLQYHRVK